MKKSLAVILALSMLLSGISALAEPLGTLPDGGDVFDAEQGTTKTSMQEEPAETFLPETVETAAAAEPPKAGEMYYYDDFSGVDLDERISITTAAGGTVSQTEGALVLNKGTSDGENWTGMDIYLNEDHSAVRMEEFVTEFTLERSSDLPRVNIRMRGENGDYTGINWERYMETFYSDEKGKANHTAVNVPKSAEYGKAEKLKFTVYYNTVNQTFTLWIDDELVVQDKYPKAGSVDNVQYLRIYMGNNSGRVALDDFKFYDLKTLSAEERLDLEIAALTYDDIFANSEEFPDVVSKNIDLPVTGIYGNAVHWESSDPSLITNDGKLTQPDGEYSEDPLVKMTATISDGELTKSKVFETRVQRKASAAAAGTGEPEVDSIIYENDFSSGELDENIVSSFEGGEVSVKDGALHMTRKENVGTSIIDIYAHSDQSVITDNVALSYTVRKEGKGKAELRTRMKGQSDFLSMSWVANNKISYVAHDTPGGNSGWRNTPKAYQGDIKVTQLFDTAKGMVSMWVNGEKVIDKKYSRTSPGNCLQYLRIYMESNNLITVVLDDVKFYYPKLSPSDAVKEDAKWLTAERLLTEPYVMDNIINADLQLPTVGKNKCNISWSSSNPDYIGVDGKVRQPVDSEDIPEVTLTATIESEGVSVTKKFTFRVLSTFSTEEKAFEGDMKQLDAKSMMSCGDTDPAKIRASLLLPERGIYGSAISWKSSNRNVITNSGRVIRPRNDKPAETVTLTATLRRGSKTAEKKMEFTVLPDDPWVDPNHMTDEAFYGKWENEAWKTVGKLDYTLPGLSGIEEAVKAGDYAKAKEEMLRYMRNRNVESPYKRASRDSGWANMVIADIHQLQDGKFYQGFGKISSYDYQPIYVPVKTGQIAKGGTSSYNIMAKYNEATTALIASLNHPNPEYRPKMEITVNGKKMIRDAAEAVTIRAGSYKDRNYAGEENLIVKMFGDFLGDETYRIMLNFDLKDLGDSDTVSDVRLILHGKLKESFAEAKEFIVAHEPIAFDDNKVTWNSFLGYVYNFNGLPDGTIWGAVPGAEVEYGYQMPRFNTRSVAATEYRITGDEKYAYYLIDLMMDFAVKKGGRTTGGQGWPNSPEIMAGFPRTLDTSGRMPSWGKIFSDVVKSEYMTPEVCTAILKTMWHMTNSLTKSTSASGNWKQYEQTAIFEMALFLPEFADKMKWIEGAKKLQEEMFTKINNNPDGSYIEKTAGYSQNALTGFVGFKRNLISRGLDVSQEYNEMLHKSAYYNLQLYGPGGQNLQWGDDGAGRRSAGIYTDVAKWFNDKELLYIDTFGQKGEKPEWTSMSFPDGRNTFMRSDWTKNALYLYTHVRGIGGHNHQDDNGVIVMAYDRILLPDSGIFTYTESDPDRIYGRSTRAHNTVEVNNRSGAAKRKGPIHNWVTNDKYDFLSQSSPGYESIGVGHRRSILFIKPDLWIVSDLMTPKNKTGKNTYKQLWHMLPDAKLAIDGENRLITSNFKTGANILIGSADSDAAVKEAMGRYDFGYQQVTDAKYGYYEKENVVGDAVFDTVLLPDRANKNELHVERIDLGAAASEATAIKFDTTIDGEKNKFYYLLDYNHKAGEKNTFEKYRTDGKLALVREGQNGKIQDIVLNEGQKIETAEGELVLETKESLADLSLRQIGARVYFDTTAEVSALKGAKLKLDNVKTVYVNDQAVAFRSEADGTIVLSDSPEEVVPPRDPSSGHGGIGGGGGGGTGGGTGGGNGGTVIPPEPTEKPGTTDSEPEKDGLTDIHGHWAEEMIQELYAKGIVNGDTEKRFHPDMPVTRAEFLAMMLRAEGIEEKEYKDSFLDVHAEDWYSGIVQAGLDNGIISADTEFRPMDQITREEMCKILVLSAGEKLEKPEEYVLAFGDAEEISDWAVEYVKIAAYHKLIEGKETGEFEPLNTATRAESATVLARLLKG